MTKAKAKAADTTDEIEAVKGFERNMQCRGYRFAVGETYTHTGEVDVCNAGFHSIEGNPLDAWSYYGPATSKYAVVKASGAVSRQTKGDSKIASATLRIEATLLLPDFIKRAAAWVVAHATGNIGTGDRRHAAATGYRGHAAATGYSGHAAATGDSGHAAATGDSGVAVSLGFNGTAMAGATGWIVLAYCSPNYPYAVERVERFKVGDDGVEAGKAYRLNAAGKPVEVAA